MELIEDCEKYFGSKNIYDVLSLDKSATPAQIKKAYRKASLFVHPDRAAPENQAEATRKFQVLAQVHIILSDNEKRAIYDETGLIDVENCLSDDESSPEFWKQYWQNLFPKITTKDIDNFFEKYKGSEEELKDLKDCYIKCEGDMNLISELFISYNADEEDRFREMLTDMIDNKEIPAFPKFTQESKTKKARRIKKFKSETLEAAEMRKEIDDTDLMTAISQRSQQRESQFNNLIKSLEAKYSKKEPKKKKC